MKIEFIRFVENTDRTFPTFSRDFPQAQNTHFIELDDLRNFSIPKEKVGLTDKRIECVLQFLAVDRPGICSLINEIKYLRMREVLIYEGQNESEVQFFIQTVVLPFIGKVEPIDLV